MLTKKGQGIDNREYYRKMRDCIWRNSTHYRPTQAIVNLEAIRNNVRNLKTYLEVNFSYCGCESGWLRTRGCGSGPSSI